MAIHGSIPLGSVILMRGFRKDILATGRHFRTVNKIDFTSFFIPFQDHEVVKPCMAPGATGGMK
jgi:hypothetical protein